MKNAYKLSTLTGTQVLLLVVSETGPVYTFTAKLQPLVPPPKGKNLIQACLNVPRALPSNMPLARRLTARPPAGNSPNQPEMASMRALGGACTSPAGSASAARDPAHEDDLDGDHGDEVETEGKKRGYACRRTSASKTQAAAGAARPRRAPHQPRPDELVCCLLRVRRALTELGFADKYEGVVEPDGELTLTEAFNKEDAPRPFKCYLDVGLRRTSSGSRVFGAMKGASDGSIPHSERCFHDPEAKTLDAEVLKKYMESLEEEDNGLFKKQFAMYLADGDPTFKPTEKSKDWKAESLKHKTHRLTHEQRVENIQTKFKTFQAGRSAEAEIDEDEEE
ncbi:hypothetical protein DFH11DRAFT_1772655 [Phellopilus nigrolimitatus]|nr:hypothetical protein DFH11DRAFT_1772655 [Phellopilus nigrolimitatus]